MSKIKSDNYVFCFASFWIFRSTNEMKLLLSICYIAIIACVIAKPKEDVVLWPNGAPGEGGYEISSETTILPKNNSDVLRVTNVSIPTIKYFPAPQELSNGSAVLVCPGGAYNILAIEHEGTDVCEWLNSIGVHAILLKYRVPRRQDREKHEAPLEDAQRAMGVIRSNSKKWGIDPSKIGILGFSAGGNLAVMASTSFESRIYSKLDRFDEFSCRPDFTILIYPAYLVDRKERKVLFPEIKVTSDCPPFFIAHTGDDHVPAEGSALLYLKLEKMGVIGNELHLYSFGGHGYGIKKTNKVVSSWPERVESWMKSLNFLSK